MNEDTAARLKRLDECLRSATRSPIATITGSDGELDILLAGYFSILSIQVPSAVRVSTTK
jgi:hypothetical protein